VPKCWVLPGDRRGREGSHDREDRLL
jgi:hypothetical protein